MTTETQNSSKSMNWILFFISLVICVAMLIWMNEWFWLALPFVLTYFVKGMDVI